LEGLRPEAFTTGSPMSRRVIFSSIEENSFMGQSKLLSRLIILVLLGLLISLLSPTFLKWENFLNIVRQAAILNILGIGMTLVILSGGIDLSNGAVLALSSCVSAIYLKEGGSIAVGIGIALAIGLCCGMANG